MDIQEYSKDALSIISESDFLTKEDFNALVTMKDELQDTFEKKQMWRTETEMRISVLNDLKHPTSASKYWQAVREQAVFFEQLVVLSFEYRRNLVEIKKLKRGIEALTDELDLELKQIDLEECLYKKKNMELAAKDRMRELKLWSKIKDELDDGTFDTKDVNKHQLISYGLQFTAEAGMITDNTPFSEKRNVIGLYQTTQRETQSKMSYK